MAGSQGMACQKEKLTRVGCTAREKRQSRFCVYSVVNGSTVDVLK